LLGIVTEADLLRRLAGAEDAPVGWLRRLFRDPDRQAERYARTHGMEARDVMTGGRGLRRAGRDRRALRAPDGGAPRQAPARGRDGGRLVGVCPARTCCARCWSRPPGSARGPRGATTRIRAALRKEMREQPWAGSLYTFADVKDGVVTLHGFVRSDELRRGLRVLAARVAGVERVEDRMEDAPLPLPGEFV
jgi:hypothetical protein